MIYNERQCNQQGISNSPAAVLLQEQ